MPAPDGFEFARQCQRRARLHAGALFVDTALLTWRALVCSGGGYSYRLAPASEPLTEASFNKLPLHAVGPSVLRWDGDEATQKEFNATRITEGTFPPGSQWTKNPLPGTSCYPGIRYCRCQCPSLILPVPFPNSATGVLCALSAGRPALIPTSLPAWCHTHRPADALVSRGP